MDFDIRSLRVFATAADAGSFTDAAADLGVSQASVSRTVAALEKAVGDRVLRRTPHGCELTPTGQRLLPQARRVLSAVDRFTELARSQHRVLRIGYAWASLGKHTTALLRAWPSIRPDLDLEFVRKSTPTSGLLEGHCDVAVLRVPVEERGVDTVVVGLERRVAAFASDDALWRRRRSLSLAEIAERDVIIDSKVGTTNSALWEGTGLSPRFVRTNAIDAWLDAIAAGRGVGTTSEATAAHHARRDVLFRPIKDGPKIPVRLAWWRDNRPPGLDELIDAATRLYG